MSSSRTALGVRGGDGADNVLVQLDELDELLHSHNDEDQEAFLAYLKSDEDLNATLQHHDEELRRVCDDFIQDHVRCAEDICRLFHEYSDSEKKLDDFETEILTFQRNLAETSDDIAKMQMQTDGLVCSVNNRRLVSNKINEVYSALQECDSFCEEIATKEVSPAYLSSLRELNHKISFLASNKALHKSAVDNEIRPKLTVAAQRAGDKLRRYLMLRIDALNEHPETIEEQQEHMQENEQFAYRFLQLYNTPVAVQVAKQYVQVMSRHYSSRTGAALAALTDAAAAHANPLDPLITREDWTTLAANRDPGAPAGSQVTPGPFDYKARTLAKRDRSISQHMRTPDDRAAAAVAGAPPRRNLQALRAANFTETAQAVNALEVRHAKLSLNSTTAGLLRSTSCWAWELAQFLRVLVNMCVSECGFIGNFFCEASELEGGENFAVAEQMARAVLGSAMSMVEASVAEQLSMVMRRTDVLASLRLLEMVKQYLCTSLDPIPLLLLSSTLEMAKAVLKSTLLQAFRNDAASLETVDNIVFSPFRNTMDASATTTQIMANRAYLATLGPHSLTYRLFEESGQLELLNYAMFRCSTFGTRAGSTQQPYDSSASKQCDLVLGQLLKLVDVLSKRHTCRIAQLIFRSVNVFCALGSWRDLVAANPGMDANGVSSSRDESVRYIAGAAAVAQLEDALEASTTQWATEDSLSRNASLKSLSELISAVKEHLGEDYLLPNQDHLPVDPAQLPSTVNLAATLAVATEFSDHWLRMLDSAEEAAKTVVEGVFAGVPNAQANPVVKSRVREMTLYMRRTYLQIVVDANENLWTYTSKVFAGRNELQAKMVSSATLAHELQKRLQ